MNTLDLIILAFVAIGAAIGLFRGFFNEAVGTIGLLLAAIVANLASPYATPVLSRWVDDRTVASVIVWVVVFLLSMFLLNRLAYLLGRLFRAIALGWLNRGMGAVFGAVKHALIAVLVVSILEWACSKAEGLALTEQLQQSVLVPHIHEVANWVSPWISEHILNPALQML